MTQIVDRCIKDMCDKCHKNLDGPCAWLSLGNEYCDEIMNIQQEIDRLNSIIRIEIDENDELQQRINKVIDDLNDTLEINQHMKIGNNELVQLDIDHIKKIIDILRGEDK